MIDHFNYYKIQIASIIGVLAFLLFIFRLIIKGRLREEYSIVWIIGTIILIFFSIWRDGLNEISSLLGVSYPPSLLFLVAFGAVFTFLVHLSMVNSGQHNQIKDMAQEIALLKRKIEELENSSK